MATEQIPTSIISDDAVTGAKIENKPTVAGNLTVSGAIWEEPTASSAMNPCLTLSNAMIVNF